MNNQYLESLQVENYFSIKNITLNGLSKSREIYFLGENGDGKTLVLQAILLTIANPLYKEKVDKEEVGKIMQCLSDNSNFTGKGKIKNYDIVYQSKKMVMDMEIFHNGSIVFPNIFTYGANRNRSTADKGGKDGYGTEGYLTLFDENRALLSPIQWLKDLKLEGDKATISVESAIQLLEQILDENVKIKIEGKEVYFIEKQTKNLKFEQLSDGYKSVMTWVSDLVSRLAENQPFVRKIQDFEGIVLVDEINIHLHPKWERNLVKKLRIWFPNVQFFFTTHSPTMLLSASRDAIFYKVYKENGETKVSEPILCEKFAGLMANSILTSPLFDLENPNMEAFDTRKDEIDTSDSYLESKIRKILKEKKDKLAKDDKSHISEQEFDLILNDAFEKYQKGEL